MRKEATRFEGDKGDGEGDSVGCESVQERGSACYLGSEGGLQR